VKTVEPSLPVYIGIDNGISGGIAILHGTRLFTTAMFLQGKGKGEEINPVAVCDWINSTLSANAPACRVFAVLEKPGGSKSAVAASSMGDSYGALRTLLALTGIRHERITPQRWQAKMLPNCEKGQTKSFALAVAKGLWPSESWLDTPKCRVPHTGMVDAALIAEYARRERMGG